MTYYIWINYKPAFQYYSNFKPFRECIFWYCILFLLCITTWKARRCPWEKRISKNKFQKNKKFQKNRILLAYVTPRIPMSAYKKFQSIWFSRLADRRNIYTNVLFYNIDVLYLIFFYIDVKFCVYRGYRYKGLRPFSLQPNSKKCLKCVKIVWCLFKVCNVV